MLSSDSMESLSPGQEFTAVTGAVRFEDQVKSNSITLTAKADGIAELNEAFVLQLVNATGGDCTSYLILMTLKISNIRKTTVNDTAAIVSMNIDFSVFVVLVIRVLL